MRLRNNSKKQEWKAYVCPGGELVDIPLDSEFECSDKAGSFLLRTLGAPNWLTLVEETTPPPEPVKVVIETPVDPVPAEPEKVEELEPPVEEVPTEPQPEAIPEEPPVEAPVEEPKPTRFCEHCESKGVKHMKNCSLSCPDCGLVGKHRFICKSRGKE